jgi:hypothetical protein
MTPDEQTDVLLLINELDALLDAFERRGIEYGLCGGLAVASYGYVRATQDIDLLIKADDLDAIREAAYSCGFTIDNGVMSFERVTMHRFTKIPERDDPTHEDTPLSLDCILVDAKNHEAWETRQPIRTRGKVVNTVSPQGLILMKHLSSRLKDHLDIEYLEALVKQL